MPKLLHHYTNKIVSQWLVLAMDIAVSAGAFLLAVIFRFNFDLTYFAPPLFKYHVFVVVLVNINFFLIFQTYRGIVRHTSLEDTKAIFYAIFLSTAVLLILNYFPLGYYDQYFNIPVSILIINFFIALVGLITIRLLIKGLFEGLMTTFKVTHKSIIYGAGNLGIITKSTLLKDRKKNAVILCFIDDNPQKIGKSIEGIKVLSRHEALQKYFSGTEFSDEKIEVIFAIQAVSIPEKGKIVDEFLEYGITLKHIPPVHQWINGQLSTNQIQSIKIEDLLNREPIKLNNRLIKESIQGKRILVTGAAGSIGSEIVRQIVSFSPAEIMLVDHSESALYDIETELTRLSDQSQNHVEVNIEVKNVVNESQMRKIFRKFRPEIVFHAAAYKHVPMMEKDPLSALSVNVYGTKVVADLASAFNVEKFVFISTDKAVNPTNVMGATKRLAEMYVQSLNTHHKNNTRFVVTRFGNVLGSNGSVIPLFKKQIESGGPVTVTHRDIIRFFMTIPEACQLVLEAGIMGKGGEIYVFDMGEPVKIFDLAKRMIKLSGFEPFKQIDIQISGLRSGEKLYEELLGLDENTIPTYHPKILIAKVKSEDFEFLNSSLLSFKSIMEHQSNLQIVSFLKKYVPNYISNNSEYETLDRLQYVEADNSEIL